MLDFPTWKKIWLWGLTLIAAAAALPTLLASTNIDIPDFLPQPTVNLGLDLAGGSHILLEACLLYTSPSPRDGLLSRMPSSA